MTTKDLLESKLKEFGLRGDIQEFKNKNSGIFCFTQISYLDLKKLNTIVDITHLSGESDDVIEIYYTYPKECHSLG